MDINVNALTLTKALDDNEFKTELIEYLNSVVDDELEKGDRMDTDLVEDCTEIIFELENGYEVLNLEREKTEKIIKLVNRKVKNRKIARRTLIAAIVAIMLLPNSVVYATVPAYKEFVDNVIEWIMDLSFEADEKTHKDFTDVERIDFSPEIEEESLIKSPEDLDESKILVEIYHFDAPMETIPLNEVREIAKDNKHLEVIDMYGYDSDGKKTYIYIVSIDGTRKRLTYYVEE